MMQCKEHNLTGGEKPFEYGLALLRMLMCFEVVLCHFWTTDPPLYLKPFDLLRAYAVPVFMVMSFYLNQKSLVKRDIGQACNRVWKLLLPQIMWSVIYFVIYWIIGIVTHQNLVNGISDLFWQLFTGHSQRLNATMWFQFDLIVITILFLAVFYFCNQGAGLIAVVSISIFCLVSQYSGLNYHIFSSLRYELSYPLGRLAETLPMALGGFLAARYNLLKPTKNRGWNLLIAGVAITAFFLFDEKLFPISCSFGYAGFGKIGAAAGLMMVAVNLNFDVLNQKTLHCIKFLCQYTLGIYCGHRLVRCLLVSFVPVFFRLPGGQFSQCIVIYIFGFLISWAISKIPVKWISRIV